MTLYHWALVISLTGRVGGPLGVATGGFFFFVSDGGLEVDGLAATGTIWKYSKLLTISLQQSCSSYQHRLHHLLFVSVRLFGRFLKTKGQSDRDRRITNQYYEVI